ncbi:MAG: DUF1579 domain-containing protein [Thermoanaerobaculia bacterium]
MRVRGSLSVLALATLLAARPLAAQEKKAAAPPMDEKAMMELYQKMATPGDAHQKLGATVGSWNVKNTMWMDPSKPAQVTEGSAESKWILDGRWIEQRYEGTFMGQPFTGIGYTGYDNYKKKYVSTWMDTASTALFKATGNFDVSGKVLTLTGKSDDYTTGKEITMREKVTIVSSDEHIFEMWGPAPDGKEYKMMEIRYTRKK